jgi:hypothetical protein
VQRLGGDPERGSDGFGRDEAAPAAMPALPFAPDATAAPSRRAAAASPEDEDLMARAFADARLMDKDTPGAEAAFADETEISDADSSSDEDEDDPVGDAVAETGAGGGNTGDGATSGATARRKRRRRRGKRNRGTDTDDTPAGAAEGATMLDGNEANTSATAEDDAAATDAGLSAALAGRAPETDTVDQRDTAAPTVAATFGSPDPGGAPAGQRCFHAGRAYPAAPVRTAARLRRAA